MKACTYAQIRSHHESIDRAILVPKGHPTLAQRFNVGCPIPCEPSPEGTADTQVRNPSDSAVPSGLRRCGPAHPTLKRWAILILSLRDRELHGKEPARAKPPPL